MSKPLTAPTQTQHIEVNSAIAHKQNERIFLDRKQSQAQPSQPIVNAFRRTPPARTIPIQQSPAHISDRNPRPQVSYRAANQAQRPTMYILRRVLTLLLLTTLTSGYPPRYARRRRQIARPWLEPTGSDAATGGQTSQVQVAAIDTEARQLLELVVKTIVETVIVTAAENGIHEEGSEEG